MERILKEFKSDNLSSDCYEEISLIIYLASLTEEEIISNEIEAASHILHCAFKNIHENHYDFTEKILEEQKHYIYLTEKCNGCYFKIFIKSRWLFQIILINSVKHSDAVNNSLKQDNLNFLTSVIAHILKNIVIVKPLSLHLLRTLLLIVTKRKDTLSPTLCQVILKHMNKVALSPYTIFRQYAQGISKAVIPSLPEDETVFLDLSLLPIKGIDMFDIVKHIPEKHIRQNKHEIIKKVLNMFLKNVESKDGGILYECVLFYSFEEWKKEIWPLFLHHLEYIDYEGEFFQSILKYWITKNINAYKAEFYNFLRNEPLDWKIKGFVLLECRKKGCVVNDDIMREDILRIFYNIETRDLGLKIASTYHKKSLWPKNYEIDIVISYLYSNTNISLEEEEMRSLRFFFSQIFLHAHNELKKNSKNLSHYISLIEIIYKYCYTSLNTDYFEVGAGIVSTLWDIATGCHKNLLLNYKLEKKDCYECGENLLYTKLMERDMWWFGKPRFQQKLINSYLSNNASSTYLTRLLNKYFDITDFVNTIDLKSVVNESYLQTKLDNEKVIKNYSQIIFQNQYCTNGNLEFIEEVEDYLINLSMPQESYSEEVIFKAVLYLEIVMVATKYNRFNKEKLHRILEKCLSVVEKIINNNTSSDVKYKTTKIFEAFINNIMLCIIENVDILWKTIKKEEIVNQLILIIQKSNMKRPLSLSVEVLKHFGSRMDQSNLDKNYKILLLDSTLKALYESATKSDLKIRRNPESRLVIHAMCSSDNSPNKPLLKWVLNCLLEVISDPNAPDSAVASALHTIEILISDNNLHSPTLPFVSDIIVRCVELFARSSWIIRNADLQLTRAIIDRFYGVCLDVSDRPKCVEGLLVLFPTLSSYFYSVLSSTKLDERAVLVFQFFSESQIKEQIFTGKPSEVSMENFLQLFIDILQKYPNHYGKMAAHSYSALCLAKVIPKEICSITYFLKVNSEFLSKNIFANFLLLMQLLYGKYKTSFEHCINKEGMKVIIFAINDLLKYLRKYDSNFFNFVLFKVKPQTVILNDFVHNLTKENFEERLWLHNNVSFLIINSKSTEISGILRNILSKKLLSFIQIKILTILISRFEYDEFDSDKLNDILEVLFEKSVAIEDSENYLLNCYFKTILIFYERNCYLTFTNRFLSFKETSNIYKVMIFVLYFSGQTQRLSRIDRQHFYNIVEAKYMNFISLTDEIKHDIISTLAYLLKGAPEVFQLKIFKLIFYSSLFTSTYLEAYKCISVVSGKTYSSILAALSDFFSEKNLCIYLKDKRLVSRFFNDVMEYIPEHFQRIQSDGYYSEESDILVPKLFLIRLLNNEIQNNM